jgi:hypothetical protein
VKNTNYEGIAATSPSPCPAKLGASWVLDTAAAPFQRGANSVEVCASDYSSLGEANRTCSSPVTVAVDDSCAESPVPGGEVLSAQFTATHGGAITVPYRHSAKVSGELADNAGDPVPGAAICVETHTQGAPGGLRPLTSTVTDAQGHFSYELPPGPNRQVLLGYRHDSFQVGRAIRYYAHARPRIELSPGQVEVGGEIRIRGELPGRRASGRVWSCRPQRFTRPAGLPSTAPPPTATASFTAATASTPPRERSPTGSPPSSPASAAIPGRSAIAARPW